MKRSLTTIFIGLLIFSCSEEEADENLESFGTVMQSNNQDTCECNALDIDTTGTMFLDAKTFTGLCTENYHGTDSKYIEKHILDGRLHGKIVYYDKMGEILIEELYENGEKKRSGELEFISCECKELVREDAVIPNMPTTFYLDDIPFTGTCTDFYPGTSQTYMEVTYKKGLLNGRSSYYDREGEVMYTEKYAEGKLITTVH
ncbi:MAG: hypothetical protein ACI857_000326 [Arenicella sp.]|jgi:hypothetical protein